IEVEFDSVEQARKFNPPDWFGKEVTADKRYRSKNLAIKGLPG
ncbi:MAG: adenylate cyclase, partial [Candidatus Melainabacteria bacterium]|nr:adenylate cyclase [Candidatus Melainabacteria bacterium]